MVSGGRDVMLSIKIPVIGAESGDGVLSGAEIRDWRLEISNDRYNEEVWPNL